MEDIEAINEMFPDELLSDAEFEKALDALCANPDDEFKRELTEMMSEHQLITWEEAEQILGDTGDEPVKSSLPQQTRPTEPDNDTNVEDTIQRLLQNDPGLVQVNLNNMKRTPIPKIRRIIEAMKQNEFIQQLSLANMGLYDHDVMNLIESIEDNESLKKLNLETNYLSGEFFAKLFAAVNKNQAVEEVKAVNQGMNFSTQAERDIIKAIKENQSLTKISMNIRLPELRNKIQQITMRNLEIRRIMRKRAADEQKALEEKKRLEEEERARKKAELEKAKQPLKVFPKEMLQYNKKKIEPIADEEKEVRTSISKIVAERSVLKKYDYIDSPSPKSKGVAPMILGDSADNNSQVQATENEKNLLAKALEKKPVLKKLPTLDQSPVVSKPNPTHRMETKEWPPKTKDKADSEKSQPKNSLLVSKQDSGEAEQKHRLGALDELRIDTETIEDKPTSSTASSKRNSDKLNPRFKKPLYDTPLSPTSMSIMSMDMNTKEKPVVPECKLPSKIVSPFLDDRREQKKTILPPKPRQLVNNFPSPKLDDPLKLSNRAAEAVKKVDNVKPLEKMQQSNSQPAPSSLGPVKPTIPLPIKTSRTLLGNKPETSNDDKPTGDSTCNVKGLAGNSPTKSKLLSDSSTVIPQSNQSKKLLSPNFSNDSLSGISDSSALSACSETDLKDAAEKPKKRKKIVKRIVRRRKKKTAEDGTDKKDKENMKNVEVGERGVNKTEKDSDEMKTITRLEKSDRVHENLERIECENGRKSDITKDFQIKDEHDDKRKGQGNEELHKSNTSTNNYEKTRPIDDKLGRKDDIPPTLPKPSYKSDYTSRTGSSYSSRNRQPYSSGLNRYSKY